MLSPFFILISLSPILFLAGGYLIGRLIERRHFRLMDKREQALRHIIVTNVKRVPAPERVTQTMMVSGEVVIACDYFKSIASQLRNLVGGRMRSLETLVTRARREATLRMLEQASRLGATEVYNVRLESSNVMTRQSKNKAGIAAEMFAFGTAVVRNNSEESLVKSI